MTVTLSSCTASEPQDSGASAGSTPDATPSAPEPSAPEPTPTDDPPASQPPRPRAHKPPAPPEPDCVEATLNDLTLAGRAAQLLMIGVPADASGPDSVVAGAVGELGVGAVILTGRSESGVQTTRALVDELGDLVPRGPGGTIGLEVAVDQEGGQVQVLQGPGFDAMPTASVQGGWSDARLRRASSRWARQLRSAGATLNLSPVADVVPPGRANAPIGQFDREFAGSPRPVAAKVAAFVRGSVAAGVGTTVKHFPGLGRASGNTDDTSGVIDELTRREDPLLAPFRSGIAAGTPYVMMSTARYTRLDPDSIATFSPFVIGTMLRGDLGFDGLVISDDVGVATGVQDVAVGRRAVRFVAAGGDVVLTVVASQAAEMVQAVVDRARRSPRLRRRVDEAALRVLRRKADVGLLGCRPS
ncbi:MAG: glycoside hydrolase family 3 protein [Actinomycetota bacterium]|nr:glycoside hydrolase family 3 protein [Actinomycetota bacterium]